MEVGLAHFSIPAIEYEAFDVNDIDTAAWLMVQGYRGTVDWDDGDDEEEAASEIRTTLSGGYGAFLPLASLQIRKNERVVSQIVCTLFEESPLITFVYTHQDHKNQGLASALIHAAGVSLREQGFSKLSLYVTESNPAVRLYEKLGFSRV